LKNPRSLVRASVLAAALCSLQSVRANLGTIQDVKHVVILMQENHSFDSYYGTLQGVRGYNDPNIRLFPNGSSVLFQPNGTNFILPFLITNCWDMNSMGYRNRADLTYYYPLADAYTICDANFCSFLGPTFPNRLYLFTGMIDPNGTQGGPVFNDTIPTNGLTWTTYAERLQTAGVNWKVYRTAEVWNYGDALGWFVQFMNAAPGNPLYDRGMATVSDVAAAFAADVTNGSLPQVSWIIPQDGTYSEHPWWSATRGEYFVGQIVSALAANPAVYNSTVLILNYDEEGGYFDHVPPPSPPPGTPGEFSEGIQLGLGYRVPMIIVSPWTRGGRVCSQVFDHTSVIRFLETWTGVQETNITAWRRQVCGDLTSAFDFAHPDYSLPSLPAPPQPDWNEGAQVSPPTVQSVPIQEPGVRPACPLPYQPDANCRTDCSSDRLFVTMTNAGAASVHFAIYPNAARSDGPWPYDAPLGTSVMDAFVQPAGANGFYDFTCYGPNGFQRRFAGNLLWDCGQVEIASQINPTDGGVSLTLLNSGLHAVNFTVADHLNAGALWSASLPSASATNRVYLAVANNNGWYDLTVTTDADTNFLRHLAGHVETGAFSFTEIPVIVGNTLTVATNNPANPTNHAATGSIYTVADQLVAQNPAAAASTNSLALLIGTYGTNCALVYPGWASNYVVEFSPSLRLPVWTTNLPATLITVSNFNVLILPQTNSSGYFRLRQ